MTGGATIETYSVEMDHDGSGFVEVTTAPITTSPAIISNPDVTSGAYLTFRYKAYNVHGWSEYSDSFVIVAATIPDAPTNAATVSTLLDSSMTLRWVAPVNTGGNAVLIEEYRVQVLHYDLVTFTEVPAGCNPDSVETIAT